MANRFVLLDKTSNEGKNPLCYIFIPFNKIVIMTIIIIIIIIIIIVNKITIIINNNNNNSGMYKRCEI